MASLQVLGTGLPRCGTASLKAALEILGFDPCYHMLVVLQESERSRAWSRVYQDVLHNRKPDFESVLHGYKAAVDAPASEVWEDILAQYPDIKIIHTTRDAQQWWVSMEATILKILDSHYVYPMIVLLVPRLFQQWLWAQTGFRRLCLRNFGEISPKIMQMRRDQVKKRVPAGQLLEYKLGSGWEPICEFLQVPVPSVPFPRVNDKEAFAAHMKAQIRVGLRRWAYVLTGASVLVALAIKAFR